MSFLVIRGADDMRTDAPTYVYVLHCSDFVKIGLSRNVEARRANLQNSCPLTIEIASMLLMPGFAEAKRVERELHARFAEHRGFGEWFSVPPDTAVAALAEFSSCAFAPPATVEKKPRKTERPGYLRSLEF